ncbi:YtxH domain-containing protein [Scrofimicrobium sp. R131]|uniref:YtxH domain-containing protein n=1 Tax=Scrofimicrobium appendicitidis TaxID=3079930 RepID=A0AAU7V7I1_9ACTO
MGTKAGIILGLGIGFVLGARAGREKYEQIKGVTRQLRTLPIVSRPLDAAGEKVADVVRSKGNEISDAVADVVKEKVFGMPTNRLVIDATVVEHPRENAPESPDVSAPRNS